jgi:nitrous oxidase accessory protein NosD
MKLFLFLLFATLQPTLTLALEYQGENTIYQDTVWQGEVLIDGILTIAGGATLEIRPGTRVRFTRRDTNGDGIGESEIFAQGRLVAKGTFLQPVIFTSAEIHPRRADWGALNMMMSEESGNLLENCVVEYAYRGFHAHFSSAQLRDSLFRYNQRAAQFQESDVEIDNCTFENNFNGLQFRDSRVQMKNSRVSGNHWGVRAVFVELQMTDNRIENNLTNGVSLRDSRARLVANLIQANRRGLYLQRCQAEVSHNQIYANLEHGIYLEESQAQVQENQILGSGRSGIKIFNLTGQIENNHISGSGEFTFFNAGTADFSIGSNWYGAANARPQILDGRHRPGAGILKLALPQASQPEGQLF